MTSGETSNADISSAEYRADAYSRLGLWTPIDTISDLCTRSGLCGTWSPRGEMIALHEKEGFFMKRRILIIDDEPKFTKVVRLALEATESYEVRELNDPTMAVQVARDFSPDIILLDVVMPEIDGGDVLSLLSADPVLKNIPVIFVTAIVRKKEVEEHKGHIGGALFIAKPVTPKDLVQSIEEVLSRFGSLTQGQSSAK